MTTEYVLKRYAAYYRGWCQAFGEHESVPGEDTGISWLFGENQIGFISPREQTKLLLREILRKRYRALQVPWKGKFRALASHLVECWRSSWKNRGGS